MIPVFGYKYNGMILLRLRKYIYINDTIGINKVYLN